MTLQALREQRGQVVAKMRGVIDTAAADNRSDLNEAETKDYAALEAKVTALDAQIQRVERLEATEARLEEPAPAAGARARPTKGPEAKKEFSSLGEFFYAARFNPDDQRLQFVENSTNDGDTRGEQRMDDGASGGFAIPVQFRNELLSVDPLPAVMRPRATVIPAGNPPDGAVLIPALDQSAATNMYGGVTVAWIGEGGTKPDTSAKIRQIELRPQEVAGTITITDKLLRNWQASGPLLSGLLRKAINAAEDVAFLTGNGIAKPLGVLNSTAAILVTRTNAGQITYADVLAMEETLFANDGGNSFWVCSKRARTWLRQLKNPAGYYIWQEDARGTTPAMLLGHEVVVSDRVPTLGTKGDLMLIDGDDYLIKDGSGPFVAMSEHVNFSTNKTVIKCFWNVDGQPWVKDPIKTENGELQTPFVILN